MGVPPVNLADGARRRPAHTLPKAQLHPYLAGLPHARLPELSAARPVSLEALAPSPSPPGGGGAKRDETEQVQVQVQQSLLTHPLPPGAPWS